MSAILRTEMLTRIFGGLTAVKDASLDFPMGVLHAVIGPNGAGKTTLINMLSGDLKPSQGRILYDGRVVSGLRADQLSLLGIGRSYQKTNIMLELPVLENVRLAAQSRLTRPMRFFTPAARRLDLVEKARSALARVGLTGRETVEASALSHGEQRQLEIAMTLATEPRVMLLDEPLAGMGPEETGRMVELLQGLTRDHAVVLVEHDMDVVFSVADTLTVMVNGQVLESGPPEQIRASRAVREAYLGEDEIDA